MRKVEKWHWSFSVSKSLYDLGGEHCLQEFCATMLNNCLPAIASPCYLSLQSHCDLLSLCKGLGPIVEPYFRPAGTSETALVQGLSER